MTAKPLSETDSFILFQEHEDIFLFDKDTNSEIWRTSMYGNATCGLVSVSNEWAIAGGQKLILWKNDIVEKIDDEDLQWIYDMRQIGETEVHILTDPWKYDAAIWLYNIETGDKRKIRNFDDYKRKEYAENILW